MLTLDLRLLRSTRQRHFAVARGLRLFTRHQAARLVVHTRGGVAQVHRTILVAIVYRDTRGVDRQLHGIGAQTVHLGIGIGEHPTLQQTVFRRLDAWHQVGRGHGDLLGFLEDIGRVAVQDHLPDFALSHVRPDLGGIQRIKVEGLQLFRLEHLHIQIPLGEVALVDMRDQIVGHVAVVLALNLCHLFRVKVVQPLQALPVELHIAHVTLGVDQFIGVYTVTVHFAIAGRGTCVGVQLGQGTRGFWNVGEEVEAARVVIQVGTRVRLEGVNHVRELDCITDKEGGEIVAHQVPVAVCGVELGRETARVAQGFWRVGAVDNGRETHKYRSGFALGKYLGLGQVAQVIGHGKRTVSAGAASMHNTLRNAFAVKALQLLQQLHVLQQHRAIGPGGLRVLVITDSGTVVTGQRGGLGRNRQQAGA